MTPFSLVDHYRRLWGTWFLFLQDGSIKLKSMFFCKVNDQLNYTASHSRRQLYSWLLWEHWISHSTYLKSIKWPKPETMEYNSRPKTKFSRETFCIHNNFRYKELLCVVRVMGGNIFFIWNNLHGKGTHGQTLLFHLHVKLWFMAIASM
jgi:hypothetical protein